MKSNVILLLALSVFFAVSDAKRAYRMARVVFNPVEVIYKPLF